MWKQSKLRRVQKGIEQIVCFLIVTRVSGVVSSEFSVQVAVEMPFDIRTIQSPSHELRIKVCTMKLHLFDLLLFWALCRGQLQWL